MKISLMLLSIFVPQARCDNYNIWLGASFTSDWQWDNSGLLLSDTYAPWAVDQPAASTGHVYMSYNDNFLYAVGEGQAGYEHYMCEAVPDNNSCPDTFGSVVLGSCYRLGWTSTGNSWTSTRSLCQGLNASLLELTTEAEYNFISGWLRGLAPKQTTMRLSSAQLSTDTEPGTTTEVMTSKYTALPSFTTKLTSMVTSDNGQETSYTYVTCYVAPAQMSTVPSTTARSTSESTALEHQTTPTPASSNDFDPATQPDMAIIPASIGLTAMTALALFMIGIVILDVGALKRDTKKLIRNVRHLCRKVKSRRVHAEGGAGGRQKAAGRRDPELEELAENA